MERQKAGRWLKRPVARSIRIRMLYVNRIINLRALGGPQTQAENRAWKGKTHSNLVTRYGLQADHLPSLTGQKHLRKVGKGNWNTNSESLPSHWGKNDEKKPCRNLRSTTRTCKYYWATATSSNQCGRGESRPLPNTFSLFAARLVICTQLLRTHGNAIVDHHIPLNFSWKKELYLAMTGPAHQMIRCPSNSTCFAALNRTRAETVHVLSHHGKSFVTRISR